jgi:type IV pilus assembly protein PilM
MLINNPFNGAFGLDIGDTTIKLLRLKKHWRPRHGIYFDIKDIRQINLPAGSIESGEILQPELVKEKLKVLLGKHARSPAIKTPWVVANLPVAKSFLKLIRVNASEEEVDDQAVRFEASKHLPMDMKDMDVDWQIIKKGDSAVGVTSILVGAAPKAITNSYCELLESIGLAPLALEVEDLSVARSLITANKTYENEARAILDLGGSQSSMIIYDKGSIQFSALIPFSGDLIDTALTQRLNIERAEATQLKNANGLNFVNEYPDYLKVMTEMSEKLVENIYQKILFYRDHFSKPNPITHITMSGGLSSMINLDKFLTDKLQTETCPGNVWKNLFNENIGEDRSSGLVLASAIGLAIRAASWPIEKRKL